MITVSTVVAFAIRDPLVLDQLGEALRDDLVVADPYLRRIASFADEFFLKHHRLPGAGDWDLWIESLDKGMTRDGTREKLGTLLAKDLSEFTPAFFAPQALEHLKQAAAQVALARLNEVKDPPPEALITMAQRLEQIRGGGVAGLARLRDVDTWARPVREDDLIPTGYARLDEQIGGWGKELWMFFADSGVGKSILLQNCLANAARLGKRALHVTLELGLRPQIHRYYRQLAQATRSEFVNDNATVRDRLAHWFRFAQGEIYLLEYPAYSLEPDMLKRTIDRLSRSIGQFDILALDYLDLMTLPAKSRAGKGYEDLGRLTHETRSLCPGFDITVLTATQAVRKPERADRLTMKDMGDSYNKVRGADGLLSLVQTPEEEEVFQGRLGIVKVRDSGGRGQEIALYINRELSMIAELDHPNTIKLMRKLGHLPGAPAAAARGGGLIKR